MLSDKTQTVGGTTFSVCFWQASRCDRGDLFSLGELGLDCFEASTNDEADMTPPWFCFFVGLDLVLDCFELSTTDEVDLTPPWFCFFVDWQGIFHTIVEGRSSDLFILWTDSALSNMLPECFAECPQDEACLARLWPDLFPFLEGIWGTCEQAHRHSNDLFPLPPDPALSNLQIWLSKSGKYFSLILLSTFWAYLVIRSQCSESDGVSKQ